MKNRVAIYAALFVISSPILAKTTIDTEVAGIIALTRETQSTYAAYFWNKITLEGMEPIGEWSAEFHSGHMHRVETPRDRIIADCKAMTGTYLSVETGERIKGTKVANAACGINTNQLIISGRKLGNKKTSFGEVKMIEINDSESRRTYDVSKDGILLAATISDKGKDGKVRLINKATRVSRQLPSGDIFTEESLGRSVVSEKYRKPSGKRDTDKQ